MTRDEVIAGLREAADFIEQHPDIEIEFSGSQFGALDLRSWADSAEEMGRVARSLGRADKDYSDSYACVERVVGGLVRLGAIGDRDQVCERIVTGTRTVEKPIMEETGTETVEEEIVEWRCDPILEAAA